MDGNQRNTHLSKLDGAEPALLELFWLLLTDPGIFPAPNCRKQSLYFLANHFKHFLLTPQEGWTSTSARKEP